MTGHAHCLIGGCGWSGPVELQSTAERRAVWHVFVRHPEVWRSVPGLASMPRVARPEGPVS